MSRTKRLSTLQHNLVGTETGKVSRKREPGGSLDALYSASCPKNLTFRYPYRAGEHSKDRRAGKHQEAFPPGPAAVSWIHAGHLAAPIERLWSRGRSVSSTANSRKLDTSANTATGKTSSTRITDIDINRPARSLAVLRWSDFTLVVGCGFWTVGMLPELVASAANARWPELLQGSAREAVALKARYPDRTRLMEFKHFSEPASSLVLEHSLPGERVTSDSHRKLSQAHKPEVGRSSKRLAQNVSRRSVTACRRRATSSHGCPDTVRRQRSERRESGYSHRGC